MGANVLQFRAAESGESCTCFECGVEFASPVLLKRRDDGKRFYCPNGHQQHFTETVETRLRRDLESEKRKREQAERDVEWQRSQAKTARAQETRAKNQLKRLKSRVEAGVCIHCNRTFQNLARHMESKHKCTHGDSDTTN